MIKVFRPSPNKLTRGFSSSHSGYDIDDIPDKAYRASFDGEIIISKNTETRTWIANGPSDPFLNDSRRPTLITEDYGNYIKIKGSAEGKTLYQLGAHFQPGSVLAKGTRVKAGDVVAQAGNTGNSTGDHSHTEIRNDKNIPIAVEFIEVLNDMHTYISQMFQELGIDIAKPEGEIRPKLQEIIDGWKKYTEKEKLLAKLEKDLAQARGEAAEYETRLQTIERGREEDKREIEDLRKQVVTRDSEIASLKTELERILGTMQPPPPPSHHNLLQRIVYAILRRHRG